MKENHEYNAPAAHTHKRSSGNRLLIIILIAALVTVLISVGIIYLKVIDARIYIEKAEISAPEISLGPEAPGILDKVFVKEGDAVRENMIVAMVNGNPIRAKTDGIVISVQNTPGQLVSGQQAVVKMIDPREFRLVGHIEEDKGLNYIKEGQTVIFTVDAFGTKQYSAVVDSVSPTARQSDIVFSISDQREEREFDIKAKYEIDSYPELKNGMSAKMWVYK